MAIGLATVTFSTVLMVFGSLMIRDSIKNDLWFRTTYAIFLQNHWTNHLAYTIASMVIGALLIAVSVVFTILSYFEQYHPIIRKYAHLPRLMLFVGVVTVLLYGFVTKDSEMQLTIDLTRLQVKYYNSRDNESKLAVKSWDDLQETNECCGTYNYTSWANEDVTVLSTGFIPRSCCRPNKNSSDCNQHINRRNLDDWSNAGMYIFTRGCVVAAGFDLGSDRWTIGLLSFLFWASVLDVCGCGCGCGLQNCCCFECADESGDFNIEGNAEEEQPIVQPSEAENPERPNYSFSDNRQVHLHFAGSPDQYQQTGYQG